MSFSNWLQIIAVGGWIIGYLSTLSYAQESKQIPVQSPPIENHHEGHENNSQGYTTDSPLPVFIVKDKIESQSSQKSEEESKKHDQSDLDAQWKAANAASESAQIARDQLWLGWWQFWLAVGGTIALIYSLVLSRIATRAAVHAVEITKDTAKRQLRAYLVASSGSIERIAEGYILTAVIGNSGQTPAFSIKHNSESFCGKYPDGGPPPILDVNNTHYSVIGAGDEFFCAQRLITDDPDRAMREVQEGKIGFWIHGIVKYADCFGDTHTTKFRLVFGGRIAKSGGLIFHNDKYGNEAE